MMTAKENVLHHLICLREALHALEEGYCWFPYDPRIGICYNVLNNIQYDFDDPAGCRLHNEAYELIKRAIASWPGCKRDEWGEPDDVFPVDDSEWGGYYPAANRGELYQNPLRVQLLEHMIKELSDA